ncbi:MAG: hypothetical protein ACRDH2_09930, partial [Anaerolineales bacterium]
MLHSSRLVRCWLALVLVIAAALANWFSPVRPAQADSAVGKGDALRPVVLTTGFGRVTFRDCNGVCRVKDVDPASAGAVQSWQDFVLTRKGLRTTFTNSSGKTTSFMSKTAVVCLRFTAAEAAAVGGANRLRVAYFDKRIKDCNRSGCVTGRWYVLR